MIRFSLLFALLNMAVGAALAADPAFCESMCGSEHRECRAGAQAPPLAERLGLPETHQRNPLARTAQGAVPGQDTRALDAAGANGRRMTRLDACDGALQRCTRACAVRATSSAGTSVLQAPAPAGSSR